MTDSKARLTKILETINVFKGWKWQNLAVLAIFALGVIAILSFSGVMGADAERIDALNARIEALNSTIGALTTRLENYEKILGYRLDAIERKVGINYKEINSDEKNE
ncbi:MAG: hypothetical protein K8S87_11400 [Planctomycetes bacterium]|nr:hypothetical protein [Planctomycetota bacterium]